MDSSESRCPGLANVVSTCGEDITAKIQGHHQIKPFKVVVGSMPVAAFSSVCAEFLLCSSPRAATVRSQRYRSQVVE